MKERGRRWNREQERKRKTEGGVDLNKKKIGSGLWRALHKCAGREGIPAERVRPKPALARGERQEDVRHKGAMSIRLGPALEQGVSPRSLKAKAGL